MNHRAVAYRGFKNRLFQAVVVLFTVMATVPLLLILYYIFSKGIPAINWNFLTNRPRPVGATGGGIYPAIVGTLMLVAMAAVIAIPFGVGVGIYTKENPQSKIASWTRISVDVLQGIPSIVFGIILYYWLAKRMHFSALSGSFALALMMLPPIIKSTEETLKLIPESLKEASLALGVPYYKTIMRVIIPAGMSGIFTGIVLSIARIAGETAPLLFTAFGNDYVKYSPLEPVDSLPARIFKYVSSPFDEWHRLAWGASVILILFVLLLNILTKIMERKWKVQF